MALVSRWYVRKHIELIAQSTWFTKINTLLNSRFGLSPPFCSQATRTFLPKPLGGSGHNQSRVFLNLKLLIRVINSDDGMTDAMPALEFKAHLGIY